MQNIINNMTGYLLLSCTEGLLPRVHIKFCTFNDTCMSAILSGLNSSKNVMLRQSLSLERPPLLLSGQVADEDIEIAFLSELG